MSLWRTIHRAGGQFTAPSASICPGRRTEVRRGKLKLAPRSEMNRERERGSALLIVFLLAAFVAIMLYKEMPDVLFEAQRQKEQVLIDRGDEYEHAIKLFYRRNQRFPTSLDQLDKFNNIRYIRHQFKDPLTGKDEWRLIHISGPGFNLTDSKVTQPKTQAGQNGASAFGSSSTSSAFGSQSKSSTFDSPDSGTPSSPEDSQAGSDQTGGAEAAALARRRPPEAPANTFGGSPQSTGGENANEDGSGIIPGADANAQPAGNQMGGGVPAPNGTLGPNGMQNGTNPATGRASSENGNALQPQSGQQPQGAQPQSAQTAGLAAVNNALRQPGQATAVGTSSMGTMFAAGSIAGVASKGKGKSIKVIDKQTDYSKWEFVYNPQKEMAQKMNAAMPSPNANGQNPTSSPFFSPSNGTTPNPSTSTNSPSQ